MAKKGYQDRWDREPNDLFPQLDRIDWSHFGSEVRCLDCWAESDHIVPMSDLQAYCQVCKAVFEDYDSDYRKTHDLLFHCKIHHHMAKRKVPTTKCAKCLARFANGPTGERKDHICIPRHPFYGFCKLCGCDKTRITYTAVLTLVLVFYSPCLTHVVA